MSMKGEIVRLVVPRERPVVTFGESRTKQAFRDEVNINNIMKRFAKGQMITHFNTRQPFYGDVSEIKDYRDALNVVIQAEELFSGMSAQVREKFDNDPAKMIEFLSDEKNRDEAIKLGLVRTPEPESIGKVTIVDGSGKPVELAAPAGAGSTPKT